MFTRTLSALGAAALTVATLAFATPVHAAPADEAVVAVDIGDLDLGTDSGVARLERRVRFAAKRICGYIPPNNLAIQRVVLDCHADVIANARTDVGKAIAAARPVGQQLALRTR